MGGACERVALHVPSPAEVQSNFNGNCRHFMRCEMILLHHYVQRRQKKKRKKRETNQRSISLSLSLPLVLTYACLPPVSQLTAFAPCSTCPPLVRAKSQLALLLLLTLQQRCMSTFNYGHVTVRQVSRRAAGRAGSTGSIRWQAQWI